MSADLSASTMTYHELHEKLSRFSPVKIELIINKNRSTYLRVLEKNRKWLKLSLHRLFLQASEEVLEAAVHYALRKDAQALQKLSVFTEKYFATVRIPVDPQKLISKGKVYDLKEVFSRINKIYFNNSMDLHISWFRKPNYRTFTSMTLGTYDRHQKLVRVNQLLDDDFFPSFFIDYIMYHEMLHEVCLPHIDKAGRRWVHTPLFRKREKEFLHYEAALAWEKKWTSFLKPKKKKKKKRFYGWP